MVYHQYAYVPIPNTLKTSSSIYGILVLQFVGVRSVFNSLNFLYVLGIALLKGGRIHVFEIWVHMSQPYNMILLRTHDDDVIFAV